MSNHQNDQKYPYGYGLSRTSLFKLYMNKANVMKWSFYLSISGFLLLYLWSLLKEYVFINEVHEFLDGYVVALGFFYLGLAGIVLGIPKAGSTNCYGKRQTSLYNRHVHDGRLLVIGNIFPDNWHTRFDRKYFEITVSASTEIIGCDKCLII